MKWLSEHTSEIEDLVSQGTPQSLTYAALRCRMALELVCYHRLRTVHDYISVGDLRDWRPRAIVDQLIQEVDPHIASSNAVSISKTPIEDGAKELTLSDYKEFEYVEVGRQAGFDVKRLGKIWHSLGNFLHVRIPKSSDAELTTFGKVEDIQRKVKEALKMLKDLERGTIVSSGLGNTVTFKCTCGFTNKRRARLLKHGQIVSCVNPKCAERWNVSIDGDDIGFEQRTIPVSCKCGKVARFVELPLLQLERNRPFRFVCKSCRGENIMMWRLMHAQQRGTNSP